MWQEVVVGVEKAESWMIPKFAICRCIGRKRELNVGDSDMRMKWIK